MILIIYVREGVTDMRSFRSRTELTDWIRRMHEMGEEFEIIYEETK